MKKLKLTTLILIIVFSVKAQDSYQVENEDFQRHKGFYLSLGGGLNFASVTSEVVNEYNLTFKGTGGIFDFKIGGAIKENFILHATLTSTSMSGPEVSSNGYSENTSNDLTISEAMIGVGLTYYTPTNIFLSGSLGLGNFTLNDSNSDVSVSTDRGFSMQLKIGKEWWVSKKWGLGVALTYSKSKLKNTPGGSIEELMNSNNFGILFNATLN